MASHPFNPEGSKLPLFLTLGGMIILGITTVLLGILFWSEPEHEADESTEGMFFDALPQAPLPEANAGGHAPGNAPD